MLRLWLGEYHVRHTVAQWQRCSSEKYLANVSPLAYMLTAR